MKEFVVNNEFEKEIAYLLIKGKSLNSYCLSLIACGELSIKSISDIVLSLKNGKEKYNNQDGVIKELAYNFSRNNNVKVIMKFVRRVNEVPIDILSEPIMQTRDINLIYDFILIKDEISIDNFINAIIQSDVTEKNILSLACIYTLAIRRKCQELKKIWNKIIEYGDEDIILNLALNTSKERIKEVVEDIIQLENPKIIFKFAQKRQDILDISDIKRLEKAIIEIKEECYIMKFALEIEKSSKGELLDVLIFQKSILVINFLNKGALLNTIRLYKIAEIVEKCGDPHIIYKFAKNYPRYCLDNLTEAIIETENSDYIFLFAKDVIDVNIEKLYEAVLKISNISNIYKFIMEFRNIDINKAIDVIKRAEAIHYIVQIAKEFEHVPIALLQDIVVESNSAIDIYRFAFIEGADIEKLTDAICNLGDAYYILEFGKNVEGVDVEKLADAIIQTKQLRYMHQFAIEVKKAPKKKILKAIIN